MTKTSPSSKNIRRRPYTLNRGTNGCDKTYEVCSTGSRQPIAWIGFWTDRPKYRKRMRVVAAFLELVANEEILLDLNALLDEFKAMANQRGADELRQVRPDLSEGDVWEAVQSYRYYVPSGRARKFPEDLIAEADLCFPRP